MATGTLTRMKANAEKSGCAISVSYDGTSFCMPGNALDFEGFRAWTLSDNFPGEGHIAYIDGEVFIDMSQEEYSTHVFVKAAIVTALMNINDQEDLGAVAGDGGRITNVSAGISNDPDAMFVTYASLESKAAVFVPRRSDPEQTIELVGTPDLVVEVVSNSSVEKDHEKLRTGYFAAGIPEYWLIDARGDSIEFQILAHRRTGYAAAPVRDGWVRSRVFDREFRLVRKKDRMGMWKYRLEARQK